MRPGSPLLILPSAPGVALGDGLHLDVKLVTGLAAFARLWDGPVSALLPAARDPAVLPFGARYRPGDLPVPVTLLAPGAVPQAAQLAGQAVVLAAGDSHSQLALPAACRAAGARLVYAIEYTP